MTDHLERVTALAIEAAKALQDTPDTAESVQSDQEVPEDVPEDVPVEEKPKTAAEVVEAIRASDSPEEVRSLVEGDSRKTVKDAAKQHLAALENEAQAELRQLGT